MSRWLWPVLLVATACGGSRMTPDELQSEVRQINSLLAETALLGEVVRAGHTTQAFAEAHRQYLHEAASEHARKLSAAEVSPTLKARLDSLLVQMR